ncbi:methyltransferase domain-containing protein [Abortiporus biennis]|nr:methyltransferase domain-containing protein [Abortiporus biennis]
MPPLQRNYRYILIFCVACLVVFIFFNFDSGGESESSFSLAGYPGDTNITARVELAEQTYSKVLEKRKKLIKWFGPEEEQIVMFPPNADPWPAYTAWDFFPPAFNCPHEVERIGALGDGGKWICGLSRLADKKDCVVYVFGIDFESSYEAEVLRRTRHCEIWGHDPVQEHFGSHIAGDLQSRTHFTKLQLAQKDESNGDEIPRRTLQSIMRANGHTQIDILKIDVEGWEFETLKSIIQPYLDTNTPLPFAQLHLEVHAWNKKFPEFLKWWEMLEAVGLRPFMSEPNLVYVNYNRQSGTELADYSFLNIKGSNVFLSDSAYTPHVDLDRREDSQH